MGKIFKSRNFIHGLLFNYLTFQFIYSMLILESVAINCSEQPLLEITTQSSKIENVSHLVGNQQRAYFVEIPMELNMSCLSSQPIQIDIDSQMASLVENVRFSRQVVNIFDLETYCYQIVFRIRANFRVTGKYSCLTTGSEYLRLSSLYVFSNDKLGTTLLNNGTTHYTKGSPDAAGWITIPCISTNPKLTPTIYKLNPQRNTPTKLSLDIPESSVFYEVGHGFRIHALSPHCCHNKHFYCELDKIKGSDMPGKAFLTVVLDKVVVGKTFTRVWPSNNIFGLDWNEETDIRLNMSEPIFVKCEANEPIHLEAVPTDVNGGLKAKFETHPTSFYRYMASMEGMLNKPTELAVSCKSDNNQVDLHKWKIMSLNQGDGANEPGIHISSKDYYPFTCFSSGTDKPPLISVIECDDLINCLMAEKFSYHAPRNKPHSGSEVYPFVVVPGHSCINEDQSTRCAQISHKLTKRRGIVKCIINKSSVYTQNFLLGLNNEIIQLTRHPNGEPSSIFETHQVLAMDPINHFVYVDEVILVRCNASYGVFALGIQLVLGLSNGKYFTLKDFTNLTFSEKMDNLIVTFEANLKIEDSDIREISCHAPISYSNKWRIVSQTVFVKAGVFPNITSEENETLVFKYGDTDQTLQCEAFGDPGPKVEWYKDHDLLSVQNTKITNFEMIGNTSIMHLAKIIGSHAGEYACRAVNHKGSVEKRFQVAVEGKEDEKNSPFLYLGIIGSIILVATIVICILMRQLKNRSNTIEYLTELEIHEFEYGNQNLAKKFAELNENARYLPYKHDFEIPKDKLEFKDEELLGSGAFGIVAKGYLTRHDERLTVAVKTVRPTADISHVRNLLSEIKIMMYLGNHSNIVGLIGAMTRELREGKLHVVVEYCTHGSLQSYMRLRRDTFINQIMDEKLSFNIPMGKNTKLRPGSNLSTKSWKIDDFLPEPGPGLEKRRRSSTPLKTLDLVTWAYQIANGMEYLGQKKVIHGDLATRNILLTRNLVAKITDFGLASHLYDYTNYIKKQKEEPVPWRWLSVEAIRDSKFSVETDIWAYGVTLWEIFSLGEVPYQGYSWGKEFVQELYDGYRLPCPQYPTPDIYKHMKKCWEYEPVRRPSFLDLKEYFNKLVPKNS